MTALADIDALIHRADMEYRTTDRLNRADFAGVTAMTGLTILARYLDRIIERLDALEAGPTGSPELEASLAELRGEIDSLKAQGTNQDR